MSERTETRISVRALVEFLLRSGDIDSRSAAGPDPDAMLLGGRIHRKIQKSMPDTYHAEVPLKAVFEEDGLVLVLYGRADGIIRETAGEGDARREKVTVDEIKGISGDVWRLLTPRELHLAQAKCYAAMLVMQEGLSETPEGPVYRIPEVTCQLTYCSLETEELRYFTEAFPAEELVSWLRELTGQYFRWARYLCDHREALRQSATILPFPYPWRKGQKETAAAVFKAIRGERDLFLQAPTGVGKTLSVIYPSVKAISEGLTGRIFYLTAKNAARGVAEEAFRILAGRGLDIRSCSIRAREKACLNGEVSCNPEDCPFARGHFDRVNEAVYALLNEATVMDEPVIRQYAERFRVCPYELSLDASEWCDAVLADYNYAFDPEAHLRRFFSEGGEKGAVFLVDEAHNLPDRARSMYSAELLRRDVQRLYRKLKRPALNRLSRELLLLQRTAYPVSPILPKERGKELLEALGQAVNAVSAWLEEHRENKERENTEREEILQTFFELRSCLDTASHRDGHYRVILGESEENGFSVKYFCIDPSERLKEYLAYSRSAVFFSATLLPVQYYKELLKGNPEEYAVYARGPFREEQKALFIAADVSARYTRRTEAEYGRIADYLRRMTEGRPGNYLCFFPSYSYLREVAERLGVKADGQANLPGAGAAGASTKRAGKRLHSKRESGLRVLLQRQDMTEAEREAFLQEFRKGAEDAGLPGFHQKPGESGPPAPDQKPGKTGGSLLGLCVLGGAFSEGIDLPGDSLIGVAVVGTGIQALNRDDDLIRDYYGDMGRNGFDFAYRFPGMCRVLQAAGRLIRTETDRGVILLLDDRFLGPDYQRLFPLEWGRYQSVRLDSFPDALRAFWESGEEPESRDNPESQDKLTSQNNQENQND